MIPQSFIVDLLNRLDVVDVVGRYVQLKKSGANYTGLCPFHNEKSPSFTVSPTKQFYHCFGCGEHGSAITFVMQYSGLSFVDAVKDLAQNAGMVVPEEKHILPEQREQQKKESMALSQVMTMACDFYRSQLRAASNAIGYLKKRGLTGEIAAKFGLGYAPGNWDNLCHIFPEYKHASVLLEGGLVIDKEGKRYDRFRDRIMFPIRNTKGQVIGFGGRVLDQGEPKYLNSPETILFQKGQELYGLFEARNAIREAGYVLVTEGYMDVVALAQWGFSQAVATLGTACTAVHIQKLLRQTDNVIFSFDGDAAGRRAARRALDACLPYIEDNKTIQFLFLPEEHDPDSYIRELGSEAFLHCIKEAVPLSEFLLKEVTGRNDLQTPEGRARIQFEAKPLLKLMSPCGLRLQILRGISQLTYTSVAELEVLFELKKPTTILKRAPPKLKRMAPVGLELQIIRLLIAHPILVQKIDPPFLSELEENVTSVSLLPLLINVCREQKEPMNFAVFAQQLTALSEEFSSLIKEIMQAPESEVENAKLELIGAIKQMKMQTIKLKLDRLVAAGLNTQESRLEYRELVAQQKLLRF